MARHGPAIAPTQPLACAEVRDRLADRVLGALSEEEGREVTRHLEWCAGCRKELAELEEGVAAVGLALEPIAPPVELEAKVLRAVGEAAGLTARERRRFRIVTAVSVVMTFVAIISLSWAAVTAGRFGRLQEETGRARDQAAQLNALLQAFGANQILPVRLGPVQEQTGGGQAQIYLADDLPDWVLVIAGGLPAEAGPYSASLVHATGVEVPVGELYTAREGQVSAYRFFGQDLTAFRTVVVTDRHGRVVLRGVTHTQGD